MEFCMPFKVKNEYTLDYFVLGLLIALALFVRVIVFSFQTGGLYSDDAIYMDMARSFLEGNFQRFLQLQWPPLYPLVSALFYPFIKNWEVTGRVVSIIFGSLLTIPFYFLIRSLASRLDAFIGCLFLVFFTPLVFASTQPLTEALLTFLFWSGIFLLVKTITTKKINMHYYLVFFLA